MDDDDLPPRPAESDDSLAGELGRTVSGFVWVALFVAVAAGILYLVTRWL